MGAEAAPDTGTTIVAVSYKDGVVIGADSRVSTGAYVSNRASVSLVKSGNPFLSSCRL